MLNLQVNRATLPGVILFHYGDVIMGAIASQITSLTIAYSNVYSDADQRKHQSSASLAFVWGIHQWPRWIPLTNSQRKIMRISNRDQMHQGRHQQPINTHFTICSSYNLCICVQILGNTPSRACFTIKSEEPYSGKCHEFPKPQVLVIYNFIPENKINATI